MWATAADQPDRPKRTAPNRQPCPEILVEREVLSVRIAEEDVVRISIPIHLWEPESAARGVPKSIGLRGQSDGLLKILFGEYGGYSSLGSRRWLYWLS